MIGRCKIFSTGCLSEMLSLPYQKDIVGNVLALAAGCFLLIIFSPVLLFYCIYVLAKLPLSGAVAIAK